MIQAVMTPAIRSTLRAEMARAGLTQEEVAEQAGISRVYVSRLLTGRADGSAEVWDKLLRTVGFELVVEARPSGK